MSNDRLVTDLGPFALMPLWLLSSGISSRAIHLFGVLAAKYADREHIAWPSRSVLANDLQCSVATVDRALEELVDVRAIRVRRRQLQGGDYTSNIYQLCFKDPGAAEGSRTHATTPLDISATNATDKAEGSPTDAATPTTTDEGGPTDAATVAPQMQPRSLTSDATGTIPIEPEDLSQLARGANERRQPLIGRFEGVHHAEAMARHHAKCHPDVCHWRREAVQTCMPMALVDEYARKLTHRMPLDEATAYVVEKAAADRLPVDYTLPGSIHKHWAHRWDVWHATALPKVAQAVAAASAVPSADETRRRYLRSAS